jgi:predicted aspartyl protease
MIQDMESEEAMAASTAENSNRLLIDTGATGNLVTSSLLEKWCKNKYITSFNAERRRQYRYANQQTEVCSSEVTAATSLGEVVFDVREAHEHEGKVSLLGMRTLRNFKIDFEHKRLVSRHDGRQIPMQELASGHFYVLASDIFVDKNL